jgi:hypothetical protein
MKITDATLNELATALAAERNLAALGAGQLLRVLNALDVQLVLRDMRAAKTLPPETTQSKPFPTGEW